jgi:hypothetical protein
MVTGGGASLPVNKAAIAKDPKAHSENFIINLLSAVRDFLQSARHKVLR